MNKIKVYTDGSCLGNPGPGGWAFLVIVGDKKSDEKISHKESGKDYDTTNNRMEMMALLMALKFISANHPKEPVEIFSDSNLLVQTITQGWKKKANRDLWQEIDQLLIKLSITMTWVKAHHQDEYNNLCDQMAWSEAEKGKKQKPHHHISTNASKTKEHERVSRSSDPDQVSLF